MNVLLLSATILLSQKININWDWCVNECLCNTLSKLVLGRNFNEEKITD